MRRAGIRFTPQLPAPHRRLSTYPQKRQLTYRFLYHFYLRYNPRPHPWIRVQSEGANDGQRKASPRYRACARCDPAACRGRSRSRTKRGAQQGALALQQGQRQLDRRSSAPTYTGRVPIGTVHEDHEEDGGASRGRAGNVPIFKLYRARGSHNIQPISSLFFIFLPYHSFSFHSVFSLRQLLPATRLVLVIINLLQYE